MRIATCLTASLVSALLTTASSAFADTGQASRNVAYEDVYRDDSGFGADYVTAEQVVMEPAVRSYENPEAYYRFDPVARDAWLADCRQRIATRDSGLGGALLGGAIGGLAGNRIAGRGNRTVGTLAGAAVGAVAGAAIDRAEDRGRNRAECEAYLDDYYQRHYGSSAALYPADYRNSAPDCTETVEYVYEDEPVRRRAIPRRATKRVPDKRIRINAGKRAPAL